MTTLFSIVKDPDISANDVNHDLAIINNWVHQWKLNFNPDPLKQAADSYLGVSLSPFEELQNPS